MTTFLSYKNIHTKFRLNGNFFTADELKEVAYSFVKEGEPHEIQIGNFLSDWLDKSPELEVKTSGSTGKPKKILLQKQHMVNSALATGTFLGLKESTTALLCLPAEYIAGKMMLVRAMVLGWELDFVVPSSNPLQTILKSYDFSAIVPLQLENSLDKIDSIKTLIVGGAAFPNSLKEKLRNKSTAVFETYGMTETITHIAVRKINSSVGAERSGSPFTVLPNVTLSKDNRNCLIINAPKVADEAVTTNDMVNLISETEFEWLGRYDNIINSGGVKLIPEQIEAKLKSVLELPYFVAGIPDDKLGQKLVLIVEGKIDTNELMGKIGSLKKLSKFEIPKVIYRLPSFSYTKTGKVNRLKTLALAIK